MDVYSLHERRFPVGPERVGALIDTLSGGDDRLWPHHRWPAMRLDGPLAEGASGGHGPVRYTVEDHAPGRRVRFRFRAPRGFDGFHELTVHPGPDGGTVLRHLLAMRTRGPALLTWPLLFRPLHDALLEDALDRAEHELTGTVRAPARWSARTRLLRSLAAAVTGGGGRPPGRSATPSGGGGTGRPEGTGSTLAP
ncbi:MULTISPECIES: SRPBCC family protein [unclassified Nocardiopsis]|uniref:SRPBCC family protein n=1 Tax=unclassified Nocardiopsis TaxID=2649073 RepID=UPI001F4193D1|nr:MULTISPECIES: SRPBCC family protein [unclassified Nocardiopsis]